MLSKCLFAFCYTATNPLLCTHCFSLPIILLQLYILAVYRSPIITEKAFLPYVYTCPRADDIMRPDDRLFVYCNPIEMDFAIQKSLRQPIVRGDQPGPGEEQPAWFLKTRTTPLKPIMDRFNTFL